MHKSHPSALITCLMPHFELKVFQRAVEVVTKANPASNTASNSNLPVFWPAFVRNCTPCTRIGLRKNLATDRGLFAFLCDAFMSFIRVGKHFGAENVDLFAAFFVSLVLETLDAQTAVSESQVHGLVRVIVSGLKAGNSDEFRAAAATLFVRVLPRVTLKARVAEKLLKVVVKGKRMGDDQLSLGLVLVLFKSQRDNIDAENVLNSLVELDFALKSLFKAGIAGEESKIQEDEVDVGYRTKVLRTLTLLANLIFKESKITEHKLSLLDFLKAAVGIVMNDPESGADIIRIVSTVLANLRVRSKS